MAFAHYFAKRFQAATGHKNGHSHWPVSAIPAAVQRAFSASFSARVLVRKTIPLLSTHFPQGELRLINDSLHLDQLLLGQIRWATHELNKGLECEVRWAALSKSP